VSFLNAIVEFVSTLISNYLEVKDGYSLLDSQVACPAELQVRLPAAGRPQRNLSALCLSTAIMVLKVLGTSYNLATYYLILDTFF
jgi:hypothetical protein